MGRTVRILTWSTGIFVSVIVIAAGAGYLFLTSDDFRSRVESSASAYSGRKTHIGKITIDWGSTAHVHLDGVQVANADWGKAEHMLKAEQVDFDIRLWPLLKGDIVLPSLILRKPEVAIEVGDKEQLNWSLGESPVTTGLAKAAAPSDRTEMPLVGRLEITEGHLIFRDPKRNLSLDGTVSTAQGKAGAQPQAELELKGKIENQPLTIHFIGGSALMLRDTSQPYPIDLNVDYGATKLTLKGTVQDPFQWTGANADLTLAGPNLAEIYPLLGIPGPPTPPYRISGKLDREPGLWKFVNTKWRVGDSDLTGDILIDETKKPEFLTAKLVSQNLAFADLAPLVGAPPGKTGNVSAQQRQTQQQLEATGDLFPNVPLHTERLRAMNMDVTLDAKKVVAPAYLPMQALAFDAGASVPRSDRPRRGDGKAAHFVADRRWDHRRRAFHRHADRRPQGARRPQRRKHRARARHVLPQLALFRHHQGQDPGAGGARGFRQVAGPGNERRRRQCRGGDDRRLGEQPDG